MQQAYLIALVALSAYFLVVASSNILYFRRATSRARVTGGPFVSVIVPARNEELVIAGCLESLLAQGYDGYEVIVVDDQSTDRTRAIASAIAAREPRLRVVEGVPLADGWLGKPHALAQGAKVARGEVLIFTDADTVHTPHSISWAVTNMQDNGLDMLSGYLTQSYGSFGERIIVPTMYAMMLLTPLFLLPRTKSPQLAFAIGQYVAIRREVLLAVGGFEAIKHTIVDDMSMAIRVKQFGYTEAFLDANAAAACRLYTGYRNAFEGITRSIYSAVGGTPLAAALMSALVIGFIVAPPVLTLFAYVRLQAPATLLVVAVALFCVQWALVSWDRGVPLIAWVLYPLVFFNLILILNASMIGTGFGVGVDWKGRRVHIQRSPEPSGETPVVDLADRSGKVR